MSIVAANIIGLFKIGLSDDERGKFKERIRLEYPESSNNKNSFLEGKSCIIFYLPYDQIEKIGTGACLISFVEGDQKPDSLWRDKYEKLNGAWVKVIVHDKYGISLGRDVAGAQALFYTLMGDTVYFSSSITMFQKFSFTIDQNAVFEFLHFLYIPSPRTIYKEVKSVLPGQILFFNGKNFQSNYLTKKNFNENESYRTPQEKLPNLLIEFEGVLKASIEKNVSRTEKAALFLSGGKDSAALAAAIHLAGFDNVEMVTLGFDEQNIDESQDAKAVADHFGFSFNQIRVPKTAYLKHWPEFIKIFGQPIGDGAAIPVFLGVKEANNRYDVFLDGTGNDRYMGIPTTWQEDSAWYIHRYVKNLDKLPWKRLRNKWVYSVDVIARYLSKPREEQFVSWNGWSSEEICRLTGCKEVGWRNTALYGLYKSASSPMLYKTLTLCNIWEPETAYRKVVQIINMMGKRICFPFLDQELINFCQKLPLNCLYKKRINKILMRSFLQKHLPNQIVNKKKGSFIFPKKYILESNNSEFLDLFLSSKMIRKHALVDDKMARSYVKEYREGNQALEDRIWALLLLHSWKEFCCNN